MQGLTVVFSLFHFGFGTQTIHTKIYCLLTKQLKAIAQNTRVLPAFEKWDNLKQSRLEEKSLLT